jgi:paxillin
VNFRSIKVANTSKATQELENLIVSLSMYKNEGNGSRACSLKKSSLGSNSPSNIYNSSMNSQSDKSLVFDENHGNKSSSCCSGSDHHTCLEKSMESLLFKSANSCHGCLKPILGQVITALGHLWHPDHFVCSHCNICIGTSIFYEKDNKPYCESDYLNLFSPKCAACETPILDVAQKFYLLYEILETLS